MISGNHDSHFQLCRGVLLYIESTVPVNKLEAKNRRLNTVLADEKLTTNILNALNALNLWDYSLNTVEEGLASGVYTALWWMCSFYLGVRAIINNSRNVFCPKK